MARELTPTERQEWYEVAGRNHPDILLQAQKEVSFAISRSVLAIPVLLMSQEERDAFIDNGVQQIYTQMLADVDLKELHADKDLDSHE